VYFPYKAVQGLDAICLLGCDLSALGKVNSEGRTSATDFATLGSSVSVRAYARIAGTTSVAADVCLASS
jgi:hypothetical protein